METIFNDHFQLFVKQFAHAVLIYFPFPIYIYIKKHIIKQNIPRTKRIEIEATLAFRKKWRRANDRQGRSRDRSAPAEPARIPAESASLNTCTASSSLVNRTSIVVTRALMSSIPLQFSDERQRYTTTRYGIPSPSLHSSHRVLFIVYIVLQRCTERPIIYISFIYLINDDSR